MESLASPSSTRPPPQLLPMSAMGNTIRQPPAPYKAQPIRPVLATNAIQSVIRQFPLASTAVPNPQLTSPVSRSLDVNDWNNRAPSPTLMPPPPGPDHRERLATWSSTGSDAEYFRFDAIIGHNKNENGAVQYLVKWTDYDSSHNSWVQCRDFAYPAEAVEEYFTGGRVKKISNTRRGASASASAVAVPGRYQRFRV